jgi:hypothetical protein
MNSSSGALSWHVQQENGRVAVLVERERVDYTNRSARRAEAGRPQSASVRAIHSKWRCMLSVMFSVPLTERKDRVAQPTYVV